MFGGCLGVSGCFELILSEKRNRLLEITDVVQQETILHDAIGAVMAHVQRMKSLDIINHRPSRQRHRPFLVLPCPPNPRPPPSLPPSQAALLREYLLQLPRAEGTQTK